MRLECNVYGKGAKVLRLRYAYGHLVTHHCNQMIRTRVHAANGVDTLTL